MSEIYITRRGALKAGTVSALAGVAAVALVQPDATALEQNLDEEVLQQVEGLIESEEIYLPTPEETALLTGSEEQAEAMLQVRNIILIMGY